ncbi:hypothetical protein CFE70_002898 [Pyrenophora teres f. teres 0-1]|uniref:Ubiquitin-like domain-containing protein n=2 Tax=Pyrenophora teres f. teres TaxID=97479 RepID=E3RSF7_PYRTT|nr:hypothetical protein PTT_11831 [Pyrenophora teres f. teres 0-1]KAE8823764.1 hypothetical protein PTNB85_09889 [Pyrenophora teres f. teres]KAE8846591.1 hypothetical protein HRS9139_01158 [Pyrenophora teres f. teres]KAE8852545.1 hypothetical protein PTNB29_10446 [Pyrenophora teres f. teres]KAE8853098.1 hypothetical protein HRS9122_00090 [Pyrenophora teres f. teres]
MSVTFGSVGDIISVCLLAKDLVTALDKTRGSKAEYQAAIRDLWILERVLLEIDLLTRQHGNEVTPELRSLWETANQSVSRCKRLISGFLARIQKYKPAFDRDGNKLKEAAMGIRWRIGEKEALEQFRVEILRTSSSLQMLLVTASITLLGVSRKEMNDKFDEAKRINDTANSAQNTTLECIKDGIDLANQNIQVGNSALGKFTEALRLKWLRQLGSELKSLMCGVAAINFATYQAINRLQAALPSPMERGLIEEPAILEDPLGRISPVHLQFITSWDAFHAVLESRFQNMPGYNKIKRRHYDLVEPGTGKDIDRSRPFQSVFLPGKRIEMGVRYRLKDSIRWEPDFETGIKCPFCNITVGSYTEYPLLCKKCLEWVQFVVFRDEEVLSSTASDGISREAFAIMYKRRGKKRRRSDDDEGDDEDNPKIFKRVSYTCVHGMAVGGSVEMENRNPSDVELYSTKQPRITEIIETTE